MVKHVFNKIDTYHPVALAIVGWLAFIFAQFANPIGLKLMLLSAARVLPRSLLPSANYFDSNRPLSQA